MSRSFFFEDQVYDMGRFQKTGPHTRIKITPKLPPPLPQTSVWQKQIKCPLACAQTTQAEDPPEHSTHTLVNALTL